MTPDPFEKLRRQAGRRSHFWPGSGFALLGHPWLGLAGSVIVALLPISFLGLALDFRPFWIWLFLTSCLGYFCFYLAEQLLCRSIAVVAGGDSHFLARHPLRVVAVGYLAFAGAIALFFHYVGSLRVDAAGMMPTLIPGDLLLFKKHVFKKDLRRGHVVLFFTSPESVRGKGNDFVVARILAVPGDELSLARGQFVVNGERSLRARPLGKQRLALIVPQAPKSITVPPGCWFVVQDEPHESFDSRVLSWVREADITATRAICLMGQGFAQEVK